MTTKLREAKTTERCVYGLPVGTTIFVEGTTKDVMGIADPFNDKQGFSNPACRRLMMIFAENHKMFEYCHETCFYVQDEKGAKAVMTSSMFKFV